MDNVYQENDYKNREDYLRCIADDYGISYNSVKDIADVLGEEEDFDALITALEDAEGILD